MLLVTRTEFSLWTEWKFLPWRIMHHMCSTCEHFAEYWRILPWRSYIIHSYEPDAGIYNCISLQLKKITMVFWCKSCKTLYVFDVHILFFQGQLFAESSVINCKFRFSFIKFAVFNNGYVMNNSYQAISTTSHSWMLTH